MIARHVATLVYVDPASFASSPGPTGPDAAAQLSRLGRAGVPVAVLRRGDNLAEKLGLQTIGARVG
jgi:hypothetical protein